jgi:signal transduction histidine kinase
MTWIILRNFWVLIYIFLVQKKWAGTFFCSLRRIWIFRQEDYFVSLEVIADDLNHLEKFLSAHIYLVGSNEVSWSLFLLTQKNLHISTKILFYDLRSESRRLGSFWETYECSYLVCSNRVSWSLFLLTQKNLHISTKILFCELRSYSRWFESF